MNITEITLKLTEGCKGRYFKIVECINNTFKVLCLNKYGEVEGITYWRYTDIIRKLNSDLICIMR